MGLLYTLRNHYRVPDANEPWSHGNEQIKMLGDDIDLSVNPFSSGVDAARPVSTVQTPGIKDRFFFNETTGFLERDNGTSWTLVSLDPSRLPVKTVAGSYTMLATDGGSKVRVDSVTNRTVTLPDLGVGFVVNVTRWNTGTVTFVAGSGMSIKSEGDKRMVDKQFQTVGVHQVSGTEWQLEGAIG